MSYDLITMKEYYIVNYKGIFLTDNKSRYNVDYISPDAKLIKRMSCSISSD